MGGTLSWGSLHSFIKNLGSDSALAKDLGKSTGWENTLTTNQILADIYASIDGQTIHELGGDVNAKLFYQLKAGEDPKKITVYYIDDEGKLTALKTAYDPITSIASFFVDHFSFYLIAEEGLELQNDNGNDGSTMLYIGAAAAAVIIVVFAAILMARRN